MVVGPAECHKVASRERHVCRGIILLVWVSILLQRQCPVLIPVDCHKKKLKFHCTMIVLQTVLIPAACCNEFQMGVVPAPIFMLPENISMIKIES